MNAQFPEKLQFLFQPHRYKVSHGGRGGAKSWGYARALLLHGTGQTYFGRPLRILCTREIQKSIADSVHKLLSDQIRELDLGSFYRVKEQEIVGQNGTVFIFAGLKQNINNLKSYEACDICWVEEAHTVSKKSWEVLIPTIRKDDSEIWVSFNPELATDETYKRFVVNPPPNAEVVRINYTDNPWFPDVLRAEMEHLRAKDPDACSNVYDGNCKQVVEGAIYKNELINAEKEGRITRVPYDSTKPVHTFWDLGFADMVSIWFAQTVGLEFRLIDFISACQKDVAFYMKELAAKPYAYGTHYLPHDAVQKQIAAGGRSVQSQVEANGKTEIVPNISIMDGISAARAIFNRCVFDSVKCADGIQALRHYRYEKDDELGIFKKQPLHDWASHPADAFRYFAVAIEEPVRKKREEEQNFEYTIGSQSLEWMS